MYLGLSFVNGRSLGRKPINLKQRSLKLPISKLSLPLIPRDTQVFPLIVSLLAPITQNPAATNLGMNNLIAEEVMKYPSITLCLPLQIIV